QSSWWDNRITLNATYFHEDNEKQFLTTSTSSASGISAFKLNSASVENKGFEIDLGVTPVRTEDLEWNIKFMLSKYENKVTALAQGVDRTQAGYAFTDGSAGIFAQVGMPFPALFGTAYARDPQGRVIIDPITGDPTVESNPQYFGSVAPDF